MVKQKAALLVGAAFFLAVGLGLWLEEGWFTWARISKEWAPGQAEARQKPMRLAARGRGGVALRNHRRPVLPRMGEGGRRKGRIELGIYPWARPRF